MAQERNLDRRLDPGARLASTEKGECGRLLVALTVADISAKTQA